MNSEPSAPNQVWTSDSTYQRTQDSWLYLAIVLDLFNWEVVGWPLKPRMTADIVTDALTIAWFRRETPADVRDMSFEYIDVFYNRKSQHSTLGYLSPNNYLHRWLSQQSKEKMVA